MTNNLKREIPPIENKIHNMPTPRTISFQLLDATKSTAEYVEQVRDLRRRFGHQEFIAVSSQVDIEEMEKEQHLETERRAQLEKEEAQRKIEDTPLNRFIKAIKLKNSNYDALNDWKKHTTNAEKEQTLKEFENLASRRGLALTVEQIDFATNFLRSTITATSTEPQAAPQQPNVLTRIKTVLGV